MANEIKRIRFENENSEAVIERAGGSVRVKLTPGGTDYFHRLELHAWASFNGHTAEEIDAAW